MINRSKNAFIFLLAIFLFILLFPGCGEPAEPADGAEEESVEEEEPEEADESNTTGSASTGNIIQDGRIGEIEYSGNLSDGKTGIVLYLLTA
jgi:hypothetical protein